MGKTYFTLDGSWPYYMLPRGSFGDNRFCRYMLINGLSVLCRNERLVACHRSHTSVFVSFSRLPHQLLHGNTSSATAVSTFSAGRQMQAKRVLKEGALVGREGEVGRERTSLGRIATQGAALRFWTCRNAGCGPATSNWQVELSYLTSFVWRFPYDNHMTTI